MLAASHATAITPAATANCPASRANSAVSATSWASAIRSRAQSVQPASRGLAAAAASGPLMTAPATASSTASASSSARACAEGRRRQRLASTSGSAARTAMRPAVKTAATRSGRIGPLGGQPARPRGQEQPPSRRRGHPPRSARHRRRFRAPARPPEGPARDTSARERSTLAVTPDRTAATTAHDTRRVTPQRSQGYHQGGKRANPLEAEAALAHSRKCVHHGRRRTGHERTHAPADIRSRGARPRAALAILAALLVAGCGGAGTGKAGGAPATAPNGTITLTFASADPLPADTTFATLVGQDSGGHLRLRTVSYDDRSASVDQTIAADLQKGKLDVGDVGSRAWESLGVTAFRAYQDPFLITSRELLDAAVTGPVAAGLLATLKPAGITGLAIAPDSIRYLYSTRPLTTPAQFSGAKIRINDSATTSEVLTALGATPVTDIATGPAAVQALRDGTLTAIESNPVNAMENGYVQVAPYVVVNAPLFAKTDTFAVNSAQLAKLPARDAGLAAAGRPAGRRHRGDQRHGPHDVGLGLRPGAEAAGGHPAAAHRPAGCRGAHLRRSRRRRADHPGHRPDRRPGYQRTPDGCLGYLPRRRRRRVPDRASWTAATAPPSPRPRSSRRGQCTDCGNAGTFRLVIHDGRYALYHPVQIDANPAEPSVSFVHDWRPEDPVEIGTISIAGNQATAVPEVNQQNESVPTVYTFELFHGLLTWHQLSGRRLGHHPPVAAAELNHPGRHPASCQFR